MMNDDISIYISYLKAKIKMVEAKALKKLKRTQEERELNRLLFKLKNDPEFQTIFIILFLDSIKDWY